MKYFQNIRDLETLKKAYRRLAMENHPDRGGDTETMKQINAEYEAAFNTIKNGGQTETTTETASDFIRVIDALLKLQNITIEQCGSWLWITGDTKPVKEELKAAGCRWASKKKMWYWRSASEAKKPRRRSASMAEIRSKYGSRILNDAANHMATA